MDYYLVTFQRKSHGHWVSILNAIALDRYDEGPDRIRQALEELGYSSINILSGPDPVLASKFQVYQLSAAADIPSRRAEKSGHIELLWQL